MDLDTITLKRRNGTIAVRSEKGETDSDFWHRVLCARKRMDVGAVDFREHFLGNLSMIHVHAPYADFSGMIFEGARFTRSELTGGIFKDANLNNAVFLDCVLEAADFTGASLTSARFISCSLNSAIFKGAFVNDLRVVRNHYSPPDLAGAILRDYDTGRNYIVNRGIVCEVERSDGYLFRLWHLENDEWRITAGCRFFDFEQSYEHWNTDRYHPQSLRRETMGILSLFEERRKEIPR